MRTEWSLLVVEGLAAREKSTETFPRPSSWRIIISNDYSSQKLLSLITHEKYSDIHVLRFNKAPFSRVFVLRIDKLGSPQKHRRLPLHRIMCGLLKYPIYEHN